MSWWLVVAVMLVVAAFRHTAPGRRAGLGVPTCGAAPNLGTPLGQSSHNIDNNDNKNVQLKYGGTAWERVTVARCLMS
jgi:hypothetical protein